MVRFWIAILGLVLWVHPAVAAKVALVIGNSAYEHTTALPNPRNDARTFGAFLTEAGFTVTVVTDADRAAMSAALSAFSRALTPEDTAVFYYAGHGMQMAGENYLVGVEARLMSEFDVPGETVALSSIIEIMEAKANVSMIFIDACRNNPLAQNLAKQATRAISVGLAPVEVRGDGTMIAFAATPGQVAYDGTDENSPFTRALVTHLATPGLEVGTAFKRVIAEVRAATGDRQSPQLVTGLSTEIYFGDANEVVPQVDVAALDYEKAERIGTARGWQLFLEKHPEGFFADLAKAAIEGLLGGTIEEALTPEAAEAALDLDRAARLEVQVALTNLGYRLGTPDGQLGPNSRRAIASYQIAVGMQETGYVSVALLTKLGVPYQTAAEATSNVSAQEARKYDVADLSGLETDERLLAVLDCLKNKDVNYGFFEGTLYVAVLTYGSTFVQARELATRCGGHLATFASEAENLFAFSLVRRDERFFIFTRIAEGRFYNGGPFIGLFQAEGAREPAGGWQWVTGEQLTYAPWRPFDPDNWEGRDTVGHYASETEFDPRDPNANWREAPQATWGDDNGANAKGFIMEVE